MGGDGGFGWCFVCFGDGALSPCLLFTCWPWGLLNGGGAAGSGGWSSGGGDAWSDGGSCSAGDCEMAAGADDSGVGVGGTMSTTAGVRAAAAWLRSGVWVKEETSSDLDDATQHGERSVMANATTHETLTSAIGAMLAEHLGFAFCMGWP